MNPLPNAFTPAGLTFAIWGVILLIFTVYQALPGQRGARHDPLFWPHLLASLNVGWLLAPLIWLYVRLSSMEEAQRDAQPGSAHQFVSGLDRGGDHRRRDHLAVRAFLLHANCDLAVSGVIL